MNKSLFRRHPFTLGKWYNRDGTELTAERALEILKEYQEAPYEVLREHIAQLQSDLDLANELIDAYRAIGRESESEPSLFAWNLKPTEEN